MLLALLLVGFAGLIFVTRKPGQYLIVPGFAKTNTIALDRQAQFPFINVIVSSSITQSGSMIAGDIPKLAICLISAKTVTGTVVGVMCQQPLASNAKTQSVFAEGIKWVF